MQISGVGSGIIRNVTIHSFTCFEFRVCAALCSWSEKGKIDFTCGNNDSNKCNVCVRRPLLFYLEEWVVYIGASLAVDCKVGRLYLRVRLLQIIMDTLHLVWELTEAEWCMNGLVNYVTIIGSDNGLSPIIHLIVLWTNTGLLSIKQLGTKFNNIEPNYKHNLSKRSIWMYRLSNCNDFVQATVTKLVFP